MVGTGAVDALLCADGRLVVGFPAVPTFVAAASAEVFCVSEPLAFFAVVRIGVVSRDCEAEGDDSDSGSGLSNVMRTVLVVSLDPSVILWKRSTFFAPWRSSESSRFSSVSERGTPRMIPCFPLEDFGRLAQGSFDCFGYL